MRVREVLPPPLVTIVVILTGSRQRHFHIAPSRYQRLAVRIDGIIIYIYVTPVVRLVRELTPSLPTAR